MQEERRGEEGEPGRGESWGTGARRGQQPNACFEEAIAPSQGVYPRRGDHAHWDGAKGHAQEGPGGSLQLKPPPFPSQVLSSLAASSLPDASLALMHPLPPSLLPQVLTSLAASSLPDASLALMRPMHLKGARETKQQRLKRELRMQRAGMELGPGSELMLERRPDVREEESSEEEEEEEEEEEVRLVGMELGPGSELMQERRPPGGGGGGRGEESSEEEEEEEEEAWIASLIPVRSGRHYRLRRCDIFSVLLSFPSKYSFCDAGPSSACCIARSRRRRHRRLCPS